MQICLIVLIGIPGVGKTQLCEFISLNLQSSTTKINHISYDECENNLSSNIYKNFRQNVYKKVENLIKNIIETNINENKYFLLIDDNMYYRSMRRNYYNLAKQFRISYCQIFVTCNIECAIQRNNLRNFNHVPNSVINDMYKKLEVPLGNNHWEKYCVTINSETPYTAKQLETINNVIAESLENPVIKLEQITEINHFSLIHTIDLMLRKIVNIKLKEHTNSHSLISVSRELSVKKKFILSGLKSNEIFLPEFENDELLYTFIFELISNITL